MARRTLTGVGLCVAGFCCTAVMAWFVIDPRPYRPMGCQDACYWSLDRAEKIEHKLRHIPEDRRTAVIRSELDVTHEDYRIPVIERLASSMHIGYEDMQLQGMELIGAALYREQVDKLSEATSELQKRCIRLKMSGISQGLGRYVTTDELLELRAEHTCFWPVHAIFSEDGEPHRPGDTRPGCETLVDATDRELASRLGHPVEKGAIRDEQLRLHRQWMRDRIERLYTHAPVASDP